MFIRKKSAGKYRSGGGLINRPFPTRTAATIRVRAAAVKSTRSAAEETNKQPHTEAAVAGGFLQCAEHGINLKR
jgi:hypothetical protein